MPNLATYSASKSAAWSFTNAARVVLKRHGTQVVAVPAVEEQFNAAAVS
jgi:short-subunit dehydrogenase